MDAKRAARPRNRSGQRDAVTDEKLEDGAVVVEAQREDGTPLSDREGPSRPDRPAAA